MQRSIRAVLATVILAFVLAPTAVAKDPNKVSKDLREAVTLSGVRAHQQALQNIATMNGGNRASGSAGYEASVDYVVRRLERAGYDPQIQTFNFKSFEELAPATFSRVSPNPRPFTDDEFQIMSYSGSGDVQAALTPIDLVLPPGAAANSSTSGCEASDFPAATAGTIALLQRGTCPFAVKVENAQAAGAIGAVVFNEGQPGRTDVVAGTLGEDTTATIPAIGIELRARQRARGAGRDRAHHDLDEDHAEHVEERHRRPRGQAARTRPARSSCSAPTWTPSPRAPASTTTAAARRRTSRSPSRWPRDRPPRNPVRFAFWGAEEAGLVGSTRYVAALSDEEGAKIGLNLNFDMLGSPNFIRLVYDGDGSAFGTGRPGRLGRHRAHLRGVLRVEGPRPRPDRLRRSLGLQAVHRRRDPGRRPVLRRRERQDGRAGGALRWRRRRGVRPLLPPGVRHVLQQQQHRPAPDGRRRGARDRGVRGSQGAARRRRGVAKAGKRSAARRPARDDGPRAQRSALAR